MSKRYTPRAGSLAEKVTAHLTQHGGWLTTQEICALFDVKSSAVSNQLRSACANAALTEVVEESNGRKLGYSLRGTSTTAKDSTPDTLPTDAGLQITSWSDGDVVIHGARINQDDSVTLTQAQMTQLVLHVAIPHVDVAGLLAKHGTPIQTSPTGATA